MSAPGFAGWAAEAMLASTLLMALVLIVRAPVRRAFGPHIGYALWLLPLVRMVLPPLPSAWTPAAPPLATAGETLVYLVTPAVAAPAATPVWPSIATLVTAGWLLGAAMVFAYHVMRYRAFCRRIHAAAASIERIGGVEIIVSAVAPGPLAFGIRRRRVALPADFAERYDAGERALALAHELSHHRRGDLLANWAALAMLALHWFDPLAWRAFAAFRADQELANDASVLAGRPAADRSVYAAAILKTAHHGPTTPICHLNTIADLKGRLKMLALSPASRRRLATGATAVGVLLVGSLALTASGSSAAAIDATVSHAIAQTAPVAQPATPAPPAAPAATDDHQVKHVVVVRDGKKTVYDKADVDAHLAAGDTVSIASLAPDSSRMIVKADGDPDTRIEIQDIPAVKAATCGIGKGQPASMLVQNGAGPKRLIVVCTDRIQKMAADAAATAGSGRDIERNAYTHALAGLTEARARVAADTTMSEADRARATAAIDTSITELRGQLARVD